MPLHTSLEQYGMKLQREVFIVDYSMRLSGKQKNVFSHLAVRKNLCKFVNIPLFRIQPAKYLHDVCVIPVWVFLRA